MERDNLKAALARVRRNQGSPGVDGMRTEELLPYLREAWPRIRKQLLAGAYRPRPVKRAGIPKKGGGIRHLGIPTVLAGTPTSVWRRRRWSSGDWTNEFATG